MSSKTEKEIRQFMRKALRLVNQKEVNKVLYRSAQPLITQAKAKVPVSKYIHVRKVNGVKVAAYHPGNLRRSIRALRHLKKRSQDPSNFAVWVGARTQKAKSPKAKGVFKGNKVDGYYGHLVNKGGPNNRPVRYWDTAVDQTRPIIKKNIAKGLLQIIRKNAKQKGIG
jgi:hypothetical protein